MSNMSLHEEICPNCGKKQFVKRYDSINNYDKELFPKIVDKSIFDYECEFCKEKIHAPYPFLFHQMGIRDIQIGYKIHPVSSLSHLLNPVMIAMKKVMDDSGCDADDISEYYDNEDAFANRVSDFID